MLKTDTIGLVDALREVGSQLTDAGQYDEALRCLRLADAHAIALPRGETSRLQLLIDSAELIGITLTMLNRDIEALASFRLCKERAIQLGGQHGSIVSEKSANIGRALMNLRDYSGALEQHRVAESGYERLGRMESSGGCDLQHLFGTLAENQARYQDALVRYERCLAIARAIYPAGHQSIGSVLKSISAVNTTLGRTEAARVSQLAALQIARRSQVHCAGPSCERRTKEDDALLDQCAGCLRTYYCSVACQTADWKAGHRKECKALAAEGRAAAAAAAAGPGRK